MHYFQGKKRQVNGIKCWQKQKNSYFGDVFVFLR